MGIIIIVSDIISMATLLCIFGKLNILGDVKTCMIRLNISLNIISW